MKPKISKPETQKAQIDSLWATVHNHVLTRLSYLDWQIKFLIALVLVLLGVVLANSF